MSVASTNAPWRIGNSERAIYFEMKNIKIADVIEKSMNPRTKHSVHARLTATQAMPDQEARNLYI
jgi:hypothetical protein